METFDVIVIGAGPVGENVADYAIRGSDRTALLVESELLGGECSYYACIPSKALLRPLDATDTARHLDAITPTVGIDRDSLLARRDYWVSNYDDAGQASWAEGAGISVARGRGRLAGERLVEVTAPTGAVRQVEARQAVILATGSVPVIPDALAGAAPWTSRDATGVVEIPDRLLIVGGGVVACEAARWMAALGSRVTLVVRGSRLLARAEPFAGEAIAASFRDQGVEVRLNTDVTAASRADTRDTGLGRLRGGPVTVTLGDAGTLEVDEVLVATGRRAATEDLGLDAAGLAPADLADDAAGRPAWLHAVGDVADGPKLTHWGKYQARRLGAALAAEAEDRPAPTAPSAVPVPQVAFTDPQLAWVGLTQHRAEAEGRNVRVLDADYAGTTGVALLRDDAHGRARLVVDADTETLVGATFLGPDVAELLHSATVAIVGEVPLGTLRHAVASFPTAAEVWLNLLEG